MNYTCTVKGVEFDVEVDWDRDGRVEQMAVFLPHTDVELSDVLDEKVLQKIEEEAYRNLPDGPEDDPSIDR